MPLQLESLPPRLGDRLAALKLSDSGLSTMEEPRLNVLPMGLAHCADLHELYTATPGYFELLGTRTPTLSEVERDVQTSLFDPRRHLDLLYHGDQLVGYLDYKLNFPEAGDVTINLLMIRGGLQSSGLGAQAIGDLERRLPPETRRLLASVLGTNPRAVAFWERLGFAFATDARPVMTWYAKPLRARVGAAD